MSAEVQAATTPKKPKAEAPRARSSAELALDVAALRAEIPKLEATFARTELPTDFAAIEAKRREADAADVLCRVAGERETAEKAAAGDAHKEKLRARARALHTEVRWDLMIEPHRASIETAAKHFEAFAIALADVFGADKKRRAAYDELEAIELQLGEKLGESHPKVYDPIVGKLVRRYFTSASFGVLLKDALLRRIGHLQQTSPEAWPTIVQIFERGL